MPLGWTISEADLWLPIRSRSQSQLFKCGSVLERAPPLSRSIILNYRKKVVLTGVPIGAARDPDTRQYRSEEHTSELQSLMRISYAVFCLKKKINNNNNYTTCYYLSLKT